MANDIHEHLEEEEEEEMAVAPHPAQASRRSSKRACMDEGADPVSEEVQEHLAQVLTHQFATFEEKLERRQVVQNSVIIEGMRQQLASAIAAQDTNQSEVAGRFKNCIDGRKYIRTINKI